jgi:DNA-directed RNA polymerase subunit M/transcription elongation factor TFIIS
MRLNKPVDCPGCKMQVNPYVIELKGRLGEHSKLVVECASCGHTWNLPGAFYSVKVEDAPDAD